MSKLEWHKPGDRRFEAGLDRGVLYLADNSGVPWNGLISVDDSPADVSATTHYYDGVPYLVTRSRGEYSGSIKAFTYPREFGVFDGVYNVTDGLFAHDQPVSSYFGMSYRTGLGNDLEGLDYGYKIHILYNLTATPDAKSHQTMADSTSPSDFGWKLSGVPARFGNRAAVHFTIDSTIHHPELMDVIESILYGGDATNPRLPDIVELITLIQNWDLITIVDNGDGTWTATGPDEYITMLNPTTFLISDASAVYLDNDTYTISSA